MDKKPLATSIGVAVLLLAAAVLLKLAQHADLISADTVTRATQAAMGLMVAFYGNFIPKNLKPLRSFDSERRVQKALRISGWSFTLAGLAYALLSLFAPDSIAWPASMAVMAAAVAISLGCAVQCYAACNASRRTAE